MDRSYKTSSCFDTLGLMDRSNNASSCFDTLGLTQNYIIMVDGSDTAPRLIKGNHLYLIMMD